ncbi:hypothetical protein G6F37_013149 [Rhizopus arrhizus]|nr:hypothetical protein G6F38_013068 [Rhizopus arrhizus]KAG1139490.1 hypothetical protein G6F37_013149 [Rhizopus arrhizus]
MGHDAKSCTKACKLCHGKQGDHVYSECPQYRPKSGSGANGSYRVLSSATSDEEASDDNCEPAYVVPKRSHESSANERKTRVERNCVCMTPYHQIILRQRKSLLKVNDP